MERFTVKTDSGNTEVLVGEKVQNLKLYCDTASAVVITDANVFSLYGKAFDGFKTIVIKGGENNKNLETVSYIYEKLFSWGVDRKSFIAAVGGGVVTDIAGFAASTYMRGIRYGFVSTTLLAQVDAGIGGKNGVNFMGAKNIIGTFTQPEFVIADTSSLSTLAGEEILSGLGEIIKHSIISGGGFFDYACSNAGKIAAGCSGQEKEELLKHFITSSIKIKAAVVEQDERETGLRRVLNLGHTLAHAIEMEEGIPHGIAVIKGLKFAADFSKASGYMEDSEHRKILTLLESTGVDTAVRARRARIKELLLHDKKLEKSVINFVFMRKAGDVFSMGIPAAGIMEALDDMCIGG